MLPLIYRRSRELNVEKIYKHRDCPGQSAKLSVKYINRNGVLGWVYHCWSCEGEPNGLVGFQPDSERIAPSDAVRAAQDYLAPKQSVKEMPPTRLPPDYTPKLDVESLKYLYKYQLTDEEIKRYGFGFSPSMDRMIIPVYMYGVLSLWQARNLRNDSRPKYLNPHTQRDSVFYLPLPIGKYEFPDVTVLVEAAISVVKVSRVALTIGLLGSSLQSERRFDLLKHIHTDTILVWLDPDKNRESIKFTQRLRALTGKAVYSILTNRKPKCYTTSRLKEIINGKLSCS